MPCESQLILWFSLNVCGHFWQSPFTDPPQNLSAWEPKAQTLGEPIPPPTSSLVLMVTHGHRLTAVYWTIHSCISILNLHPRAHNPISTSKINILIHGFNMDIKLAKQISFLACLWRNPTFRSLVSGGNTIHSVAKPYYHFSQWHPKLWNRTDASKTHPGSQSFCTHPRPPSQHNTFTLNIETTMSLASLSPVWPVCQQWFLSCLTCVST